MQRLPRRLTSLAAAVLSLAAMLAPAAAADAVRRLPARMPAPPPATEIVPGEVIVKFRPEAGAAKRDPLAGALGLVREERIDALEIERYTIAGGGDVMETVRRLRQRPDVLYAEPNYVARLAAVPNDTFYAGVDGYARDLQRWTFGGVAGKAGINAEAAWDVTTGRPDVTIAVIDSGVALTHGDVAPNLWTNPGEIPNNGRDDDANGFVDDLHGWDFYAGDADPSPDLGNGVNEDGAGVGDDNVFHGTFVANMAAGRGNDAQGVLGAAWNCRIMPIKVFTDDGGANSFHISAAFKYAADNGADVVNASLTVGSSSAAIQEGVVYALARDTVVVASAGNGNSASPVFPASYPGVLSVGASSHAFESPDQAFTWGPPSLDGRAGFSQYGAGAVDVVAPGIVFSSSVASVVDAAANPGVEPGDTVGFTAGGTSFSAPIVAGLAALMISRDKDLNGGVRTITSARVVEIIETTAVDLPDDPIDSPNGGAGWDGRGMVDFVAALETLTGGPGGRAVRLRWKAPSSGEPLAAPADLEADEPQAAGDVAPGRRLAPENAARGLRPEAPELAAAKSPSGDVAEREPNNTLAAAQPLEIPSVVAGQIATSDEGPVTIVYGDGSSDVVEDLYRFSLAAETSVSVALTPAGDADLDLAVLTDLDGDGEYTVEQQFLSADPATGPGQTEALPNLLLPAGTYYVGCTIYDGAPLVSSDAYTLALASGAPVVTGYRVYRSASPDVAPVEANRIAQTSGSQLTFLDTGAPGGAVYYVVTALYDAGESAPSNEASPGAVNPNAPAILSPAYKKGKLMMAAAESKIVAGSTLVVDDSESFTLTLAKNGSRWAVKKKARSAPGNRRISEVLAPGRDAVLYVITPGGLRSAPVTFRRP